MATKAFNFVTFEPSLWAGQQGSQTDPDGNAVLNVSENAPSSADRSLLKTTVTSVASANTSFNTYTAKHDTVLWVRDTYLSTDPDSDETEDQCFVRPKQFQIFEFRNAPGSIYTSMPLTAIRQMYNRYKEEGYGNSDLKRRTTNLLCLESTLQGNPSLVVVIHGYDLINVLLSTPVARMDVDAERTRENVEIQDAKTKAERMRFLKLYVQATGQMVSLRVGENGSVRFPNYPDEAAALEVLEMLNPIIDSCSQ